MKGYKLFRVRKDGSLSSLFINKQARLPINIWLKAEEHPTKGYKCRKGWHVLKEKLAPHLSIKNRVWAEVEINSWSTIKRPEKQGGTWFIANEMKIIKLLKGENNE